MRREEVVFVLRFWVCLFLVFGLVLVLVLGLFCLFSLKENHKKQL